jgi:outer membrane immunogenic protein
MRKILLSTVALAALTGSALASDLPSRKEAPYLAPAPAFSWTGFYAGIEGGGDFRQYKDNVGAKLNGSGGLIGGLVGYNYQVNQFVLGLEGDAAALLGNSRTFSTVNPGDSKIQSNYAAAIRGRLGYAAFDRTLLYAAGGVAFGNTKVTTPGGSTNPDSTGYTVGAGVDYAFTPNWIGRLEYRYVDLGRSNGPVGFGSVKTSSNEVIAGLIYKFGAPTYAPVLAKY